MRVHKPLADNVLLKMEKAEEKIGSFYIPDQFLKKETMGSEVGEIESVGGSCFTHLKDDEKLKVGDLVYLARYSGKTCGIYPDGYERRIVEDTAILARVEETKDVEPERKS